MHDNTRWVPLHSGIYRHKKTRALAARWKLTPQATVGTLGMLWTECADHYQDGVLAGWSLDDIGRCFGFKRAHAARAKEAVEEGWVDQEADGTFVVHDWDTYVGALLKARENERERSAHRRLVSCAKAAAKKHDVDAEQVLAEMQRTGATKAKEASAIAASFAKTAPTENDRGRSSVEPRLPVPVPVPPESSLSEIPREHASNPKPIRGAGIQGVLDRELTLEQFRALPYQGERLAEHCQKRFGQILDGRNGRLSVDELLEQKLHYWQHCMGPELDGRRRWSLQELPGQVVKQLSEWHASGAKRDIHHDENHVVRKQRDAQGPATRHPPGSREAMLAAKANEDLDEEAANKAKLERHALRQRWNIHANDCMDRGLAWMQFEEWLAKGQPAPEFGFDPATADGADGRVAADHGRDQKPTAVGNGSGGARTQSVRHETARSETHGGAR